MPSRYFFKGDVTESRCGQSAVSRSHALRQMEMGKGVVGHKAIGESYYHRDKDRERI